MVLAQFAPSPLMTSADWVLASERLPEEGQLVVKFWEKTGGVWAGPHLRGEKHASFTKWFPLPAPA